MRVLVIEDDELFGTAVQKALTNTGYAIDRIRNGADADVALATHKYDGVLLDLGLPDMPGEQVLKTIRRRAAGAWVIILTARGAIQDRVSLLDVGADDYMVKPIDLEELGARLRAVSRRTQHAGIEVSRELEHGPLKLDPASHQVVWRGELVQLTNKEFWLLETFMRKKTQLLTRAQLEDALYGWGEEIGSNTVEVYIHYLRRKVAPGVIQTVRGVGYQLGSLSAFDS